MEFRCSDVDSAHVELHWRLRHFPLFRYHQHLLHTVHLGVLSRYVGLNNHNVTRLNTFFSETKGRSLEEIDVIFARAYTQKEWYVKVAADMPKLSIAEIDAEAKKWGIGGLVSEKEVGSASSQSDHVDEIKPTQASPQV